MLDGGHYRSGWLCGLHYAAYITHLFLNVVVIVVVVVVTPQGHLLVVGMFRFMS